MQIVKLILLVILIGVLSVAGLQVAANRGLIDSNPLAGVVAAAFQLTQPATTLIPPNISEQIGILSARTGTVTQEVGTVLGSSVQVEKEELPLHQRALQHGRYLYCQQVVKDYEARMGLTPSPSPSSTP